MTSLASQVAIVVPSCDAYADLWPPLLQALQRHWPDNAFRKYLLTNRLAPEFDGIDVISVGDDVSWSDNLLAALDRVAEPYVLLNIDDLILCGPVDHAAVMSMMSRFISAHGNYLRLNPTPRGARTPGPMDVVPPGDYYRSSTVFSLWRKDVLKSVLRPGESAWQFEIHGSPRTNGFGGWFAARRPHLKYTNLVVKGKVDPRALTALERCGIAYRSARPVMSSEELTTLRWREKRSRLFGLLPRGLRSSLRGVLRPA